MANTTPDNVSYPTNASPKKTIEAHIQDTATSVQTAITDVRGDVDILLSAKANLAGATFISGSSSSTPLVSKGASGQTANLQEWQNTSGSVLAYINTSGIYATTNTPYFSATRSGNMTGYNPSNQSNVVVYNSVDRNIGSGYNSTTGKFTAPLTGTYVFTVGSYQSQNVSQIWPVVNGSRQQSYSPTAATPNWATSGTQYLVAGDNIGFCMWSDGGTNVTVYDNGFHTFIRGTYVG